jgi:putative peptidoglycan lipid II flippase
MIPITAGLIVLGPDLGVVLFGYGRTSVAHARLLGETLALCAFGLIFFTLVMLQLRVFYAMRDGRTPTLINVGVVGVKVAAVLISYAAFGFPQTTESDPLPSVGAVQWLNIATSVSFVVGAVVGHVLLHRRLGNLGYRPVLYSAARMIGASVVGGAVAYAVVRAAHGAFGTGHAGAVTGLLGGGIAGVVVLGVVCWALRFPEVRELRAMVRG